jgi:hypothetical protein
VGGKEALQKVVSRGSLNLRFRFARLLPTSGPPPHRGRFASAELPAKRGALGEPLCALLLVVRVGDSNGIPQPQD